MSLRRAQKSKLGCAGHEVSVMPTSGSSFPVWRSVDFGLSGGKALGACCIFSVVPMG